MLNLSTAAVQTFTSLSNLDRANNRAKQSVIAVARAEDLLNNKIERRNQMQEAGIEGGMKYTNIQREIATAEADLAVKIEKRGIEQSAVNDIYMLFATNVANVMISSTQTVVILLGQERTARLAAAAATKIQSIAVMDNTKAQLANLAGMKALPGAVGVATAANLGFTGSVRAATAAMRTFMASNPILLAAMAVSTGALIVYETNFLGLKDAVNGALGVQDDFQESLEDIRKSLTDSNQALDQHEKQLFQLPTTYDQARVRLEQYRKELETATDAARNFGEAIPQHFSQASLAGGIFPAAHADTGHIGFLNRLKGVNISGTGGVAQPTLSATASGSGSGEFVNNVISFNKFNRPIGTSGHKLEQEFITAQGNRLLQEIITTTKASPELAEEILISGNTKFLPQSLQDRIKAFKEQQVLSTQRLLSGGFIQDAVDQQTIISKLKFFTPETFAQQKHDEVVKQQVDNLFTQKDINKIAYNTMA